MERKGVLFIGGAGPAGDTARKWARGADFVCAADSGLEACLRLGLIPNGIVGDMDSLADRSLLGGYPEGVVEISPTDKDETDTELGILWLRRRKCDEIVMIGGGEGRLDHSLALTALFDRPDPPSVWITARDVVQNVEGVVVLEGIAGDRISFFPAGVGPWKTSSKGLEWELDDLPWSRGFTGVSNRFSGEKVRLNIERGRLLMIRPLGRNSVNV